MKIWVEEIDTENAIDDFPNCHCFVRVQLRAVEVKMVNPFVAANDFKTTGSQMQ